MDGVDADLSDDSQQGGGQNDDGGGGLDEHTDDEHDDEDHAQDDVGVGGDAEHEVGNNLGDVQVGEDLTGGLGGGHDEHGTGDKGSVVAEDGPQLLQLQLSVNKQADDDAIDRRHDGSFGSGEDAGVDAAQNDDGHDERPLGVPEAGSNVFQLQLGVALDAPALAHDVVDEHEQAADDEGGAEAGYEQLADRHVAGDAVQDHRVTGRNDDAQTACTAGEAGGVVFVIAVGDHHGDHDGADGGDRCRGRAGNCTEEHTGDDSDHAQRAGDAADQRVCKAHQTLRQTAGLHDGAADHKEGERQIGKACNTAVQGLGDEVGGSDRVHADQNEHCDVDGDGNGNTQKHQTKHHKKHNASCHYLVPPFSFIAAFFAFHSRSQASRSMEGLEVPRFSSLSLASLMVSWIRRITASSRLMGMTMYTSCWGIFSIVVLLAPRSLMTLNMMTLIYTLKRAKITLEMMSMTFFTLKGIMSRRKSMRRCLR